MAQEAARRRGLKGMLRRLGLRTRPGVVVGLCVVMVACAALGWYGVSQRDSFTVLRAGELPQGEDVPESALDDAEEALPVVVDRMPEEPKHVVVHVDGAVATPGVYRMEGADLRLVDVVEQAGGLLPEADTTSINLAAPLVDGTKLHVPFEGEDAAVVTDAPTYGEVAPAGAININTATMEELTALSGVGEATARAIVEDRERNGPFTCPEDIMRVSGIGEKKFERMRGDICV